MRISDWSSDVCSSDLAGKRLLVIPGELESVGVFAAFADHRGRQPAIDGNLWLCRRLQHVGHLDPVADLVNVTVLRWKGLIALAAALALALGAGRIGADHPLHRPEESRAGQQSVRTRT